MFFMLFFYSFQITFCVIFSYFFSLYLYHNILFFSTISEDFFRFLYGQKSAIFSAFLELSLNFFFYFLFYIFRLCFSTFFAQFLESDKQEKSYKKYANVSSSSFLFATSFFGRKSDFSYTKKLDF